MVRKLNRLWPRAAVSSRDLCLTLSLFAGGLYAFFHVNAQRCNLDPVSAIIEIVSPMSGSCLLRCRAVATIPIEDALAGMPGVTYTRSRSLFQLSHLRCQFDYDTRFEAAKQEVLNRLRYAQVPGGVVPTISPETPTGEIYRYTLSNPKDAAGKPIYNLNDMKALEDWTLERQFRRVDRIGDVASFGGTVKRYEIQPDPDLLKRYGITLTQLQNAISGSNANVGGDYVRLGPAVQVVRSLGFWEAARIPFKGRSARRIQRRSA